VYGPNNAETMLKSLAARIVFAPKELSDAREISEELGYTTVKARSRSRSAFGWGTGHRGPTVNESDQRRALLLPQELKALGTDKAIVFYEGLPPILCQKVRYFKERVFKERLLPPPAPFPARSATLPAPSTEDPWIPGGEIQCDDDTPESPVQPPSAAPVNPVHQAQLTLADFVVRPASERAVRALSASAPDTTVAASGFDSVVAEFITSMEP